MTEKEMAQESAQKSDVLLEVSHLKKYFPIQKSFFGKSVL